MKSDERFPTLVTFLFPIFSSSLIPEFSMTTPRAIGAIELSSIGIGYQIEDEMLKAASVDVLIARTICSGKYLIVLGGSVSDVEAAIAAGLTAASEAIIDHCSYPTCIRRCSRRWGNRLRSGRKRPGRWA